MSDQEPLAVLDVGSNTIRLLVARLHDGTLEPVLDTSEFVRLGREVDRTGRLQEDREQAAVRAIGELALQARAHGASGIQAIATSAVRDAENGPEFVQRVRDATGVDVQIISGEREAELTYRGATLGLDVGHGVIVCDLGGGSAELISADASGIRWARSEKLGSGRLTERFVQHDPPQSDELEAVASFVRETLQRLPEAHCELAVFTGGTATNVALLAGSQDRVAHLSMAQVEEVVHTLATLPATEIVQRYGVQEERAQVLPAGAAAVHAIAGFYAARDIVITRHGIREGTLLA
ncbi:MAG TPA: hypothetical protein VF898_03805 [Chloroflexota bacterium]